MNDPQVNPAPSILLVTASDVVQETLDKAYAMGLEHAGKIVVGFMDTDLSTDYVLRLILQSLNNLTPLTNVPT